MTERLLHPAAIVREELHLRRIEMRAYRRSDALFEVEGRITDCKPYDVSRGGGATAVPAHQPIHDMGVRLIFDEDLTVRAVETFTDAAPYAACPEGGRALQSLIGLRMVPGWNREVRSRLAGPISCTHLMELLTPLATVAFQSLHILRIDRPEPVDPTGRPTKIDSCYAFAADGEVVLRRWPHFYQVKSAKK